MENALNRCPHPNCHTPLSFTPNKKTEMVRAAKEGNLIGTCPYHDRISFPVEQQILIAESWHERPTEK